MLGFLGRTSKGGGKGAAGAPAAKRAKKEEVGDVAGGVPANVQKELSERKWTQHKFSRLSIVKSRGSRRSPSI
jgi:hypothetical protein